MKRAFFSILFFALLFSFSYVAPNVMAATTITGETVWQTTVVDLLTYVFLALGIVFEVYLMLSPRITGRLFKFSLPYFLGLTFFGLASILVNPILAKLVLFFIYSIIFALQQTIKK